MSKNLEGLTDAYIQRLLQVSSTVQASIHVEKVGEEPQQRTFYNDEVDEIISDKKDDGTDIYAIASLTKLLLALLITIIVDKLSVSERPEDKHYRKLREFDEDPWDMCFTELFNHFSDIKIMPLPKNPTLRQVLLHFNSLPPMNFILLSPDGTHLMSEKEFLKVVPNLTREVYGNIEHNYIQYSNGNYILIGLLIKAIAATEDTVEELMVKHIFKPLQMNHTFWSTSGLSDIPCVTPHAAFAAGIQVLVDSLCHPSYDILNFALGAYSCTKDMAILLRTLLQDLIGADLLLDHNSAKQFFGKGKRFKASAEDAQTCCGIYTTLDSIMIGCKSVNRLDNPDNNCSAYCLGLGNGDKQHAAYYMAGSLNGYASCYYLLPTQFFFTIVLTNTTGRADASDHISRLILQRVFKLKPEVNILDMCNLCAQAGQKILDEWRRDDSQKDRPVATPLNLKGTYRNKLTNQLIKIRPGDKGWIANISGEAGTSKDLGLIYTNIYTFRLYPLNKDGFSVDRRDPCGWKELNFNIKTLKGSHDIESVEQLKGKPPLLLNKYFKESD